MVAHLFSKGFVFSILLCVLCFGDFVSEDVEKSEEQRQILKEKMYDQELEIIIELKEPNIPDWAGSYYFGDGTGVNISLIIAPDSGFVYTHRGCLGLYGFGCGSVEFDKKNIILHYDIIDGLDTGFSKLPLVPIKWGESSYLIEINKIAKYANYAEEILYEIESTKEKRLNSFFSSNYDFLLKQVGKQLAISGPPDIPEWFDPKIDLSDIENRKYLIRKELENTDGPEWAGIYFAEGNESWDDVEVYISPDNGFTFEDESYWPAKTCYGDVRFDGLILRLEYGADKGKKDAEKYLGDSVVPVKWSGREYLISLDKLDAFYDDFEKLRKPTILVKGPYLLKRGHGNIKVAGNPDVPQWYNDKRK